MLYLIELVTTETVTIEVELPATVDTESLWDCINDSLPDEFYVTGVTADKPEPV